ncbi:MAG: DNA-binding protein [Nanohaloarchaea archaeon]|nr:DNA-binding protein [Candidatus Nanohaloarchaea archaeon]
MDDDELEELREQKRKELQGQEEAREEAAEQQKQQVWSRARKYMTSDAKDRLSNIKAVKEDLALSVARQITMLGEKGRISKVTDERMKQILKQIQDDKDESDIKFRR